MFFPAAPAQERGIYWPISWVVQEHIGGNKLRLSHDKFAWSAWCHHDPFPRFVCVCVCVKSFDFNKFHLAGAARLPGH